MSSPRLLHHLPAALAVSGEDSIAYTGLCAKLVVDRAKHWLCGLAAHVRQFVLWSLAWRRDSINRGLASSNAANVFSHDKTLFWVSRGYEAMRRSFRKPCLIKFLTDEGLRPSP
jgi:predicted transcriptional regulator